MAAASITRGWYGQINASLETGYQNFTTPSYQEHFAVTKRDILEAAKGLTGRAVVLGVGPANDIPLSDLASQFNEVTLVDIEMEQSQKTVAALPENLRRKVRLVRSDLTGGLVADRMRRVQKAASSARANFEEFKSKVKEDLDQCKRLIDPLKGEQFSFVCSSLVCSQLVAGVFHYILNFSKLHFNQPLIFDHPFIGMVEMSHISDLRRLVSDGGRVYFADYSRQSIFLKHLGADGNSCHSIQTISRADLDERRVKLFERVDQLFTKENVTKRERVAILNQSSGHYKDGVEELPALVVEERSDLIFAMTLTPKKSS